MSEAILCICGTCKGPLLYDGVEYGETFEWPALVHPKDGTLPSSVPKEIRNIYREASVVKRNAPNAFAMMIRKGLEAICENRKATGKTLSAKLESLASRGEIPPALAELTAALRTVGNTAAHEPMQNITAPMTWAIDDLFRAVIEYVYVAPAKLSEFNKSLQSLKQSEP